MIPFYAELLSRFHELYTEIEKSLERLPVEALDWSPGPEMNTITILVIHLTGAERFLVGDVVMGDASNRNRDEEFKSSGWSRDALIQRIRDTEAYTQKALDGLKLSDLETWRVHPRHGGQVSVAFALLHALEHVSQHLGHIQITIQLWQQNGKSMQ